MNYEVDSQLFSEQTNKLRQEQRTAETRQIEERRQQEDRQQQERAIQEERIREDNRRQEEQRRQDDRRRQDDEHRRTEQKQQDVRRQNESNRREQNIQVEVQLHESTVNTLHGHRKEDEQARYAREKGVPYVPTGEFVNEYYRNAVAINNAQFGKDGKPLTEGDHMTLRENNTNLSQDMPKDHAGKVPDKEHISKSGQVQQKDSPEIERFKAYEQTMSGKVQARINAQSQIKVHNRTK